MTKRRIVLAIFGILVFCACISTASTATVYVPDNYSKIDYAVRFGAYPGDVVIVRDGVYNEYVNVYTPDLMIKSENGSATCEVVTPYISPVGPVDPSLHEDDVFCIWCDKVSIYGFDISNVHSHQAGIHLLKANRCTISNNSFWTRLRGGMGIRLEDGSNNMVANNLIEGSSRNPTYGIYVWDSDNNNIFTNNYIFKNYIGIYLWASGNNEVTTNNVTDNDYGIYFKSLGNSEVTNNNVTDNDYGICFEDSNNNEVTNNSVTDNDYGICLWTSDNNTFTNNTISNNDKGIYFKNSSNNNIYLNNFINNTYSINSSDSTNIWNSTEKITYTYKGKTCENYLGNYWDDYTGSDANEDGIGDTPYNINLDKDNYPLIEPWENYFAPAPSVFEYIFEDFNDMITVTDTGFNDFSGNMDIVNKDGVPYIEAPLNISSL